MNGFLLNDEQKCERPADLEFSLAGRKFGYLGWKLNKKINSDSEQKQNPAHKN